VAVVADGGVLDALAVGRAVAGLARPVGRLWFVTRNVPGAAADEAAVWELGRVLALEMPGRWGGLVDYRPGAADAAVRALGAQRSGRGDDQLRVGPGGPRAARLVRAAATERWREAVEADRCHLVIGGEAAAPAVEALAAQGARRIVWAGGGKVPDLPADVSVELCTVPELAAALGEFDRLGDVIAVATPAATTALADVTPGTVAEHLAQARELAAACELAAGRGPQRITVVISAGPSWGSVSTAAGAAAAGYLAGWADSGRTEVPVGVLGLMPRADSGELSAEHLALFEQSGLRLLSRDEVGAVLGKVLLAAPGRHSAAAVDLDRYVRLCQELAPRTFLSAFAAAPKAPRQDWVTGLPAAARLDRLVGHTAETVASVLGLRTGELDPEAGFFDIGMDSVMALGVRSRLEEDLGVELPSTLTFEYPTAVQLAAYLAELLDDGITSGGPGDAPDDPASPPVPATDDDLLLALERQMAAAEDQLDTRTRET
jgi:acyl carrier protein